MAGSKEDTKTVAAFFQDMRARGLGDPLLVVSDGAPGIVKAIEMIRAAERWKTIRITDFERRQMAAVRHALDQEYEARNDLRTKPSQEAHRTKLSSSSRT
jgi:transposase-like protein